MASVSSESLKQQGTVVPSSPLIARAVWIGAGLMCLRHQTVGH